jgi:hypothetical protein
MSKPLGVGIIGAGPVTQAIHLPILSTLNDQHNHIGGRAEASRWPDFFARSRLRL